MHILDFNKLSLRDINKTLQESDKNSFFSIRNPKGSHALAVGINKKITVKVVGSVGYYCAGMNKFSDIKVEGSAGPGLGENIMSGNIHVTGDVSQYAGAPPKPIKTIYNYDPQGINLKKDAFKGGGLSREE